MAINKFKRSGLIFRPVSYWNPIEILKLFQETTWPFELQFHVETPEAEGIKL